MSDIRFYNEYVAPLVAKGISDTSALAAMVTANDSRYPSIPMTINEIAVALTTNGSADASGIVTRLMQSLEAEAASNYLVANKLAQLQDTDNPGTVDVGSFLQRSMLQQFASQDNPIVNQADVNAILALAEGVPEPVTAQDIEDAQQAKVELDAAEAAAETARAAEEAETAARIALVELADAQYNLHVAPVVNAAGSTNSQLATAYETMAAAIRSA